MSAAPPSVPDAVVAPVADDASAPDQLDLSALSPFAPGARPEAPVTTPVTETPPAAPPTPERTVDDWAGIVVADPLRQTEVPRKQQAEVAAKMASIIRENVAKEAAASRDAYWQTQIETERNVGKATRAIEADVAKVDALRDENPAEFAKWAAANPKVAADYYFVKSGPDAAHQLARARTPAAAPVGASMLDQQARELLSSTTPDVQATITERARSQPGYYPQTPAGVAKLAREIAQEEARTTKTKTGPEAAAEARAAGVANVQSLPKPPASAGAPAAGPLTAGSVASLSQEDVARILARPNGMAELEAALNRK